MRRIYQLINQNLISDILSKKSVLSSSAKNPIITISRETGSGGKLIAVLVAKKLGKPWRVYNKEIVDEIAKQTHLEKKLIAELDEKHIPFIEELISDFFGNRYLNLASYHKQLVKILSAIGHRGFAVIVGRGANFLFPDALKIRIVCEMPQRIAWEMQYEKFTLKQAILRIEKSDQNRNAFIKTLFHHDQRKAHHYDLIIRTGRQISIEDAADIIVRLAKRMFRF